MPLPDNWPTEKFGAILADPPWRFETWSPNGRDRAADNHYLQTCRKWGAAEGTFSTMTLADIMALPVADVAAEDCALFLWCCCPQIPEALEVVTAWGFTYKTVAFSWMKCNQDGSPYMGLGYWTRANSELCLLATRGHPKRLNADVPQAILERRREHSRKPDCVHGRIERLVAGPYLELFARRSVRGWTTWGNETTRFDPAEELIPNADPGCLQLPLTV